MKNNSPDIAQSGKPVQEGPLSKVGMTAIEVLVNTRIQSELRCIPASLSLHVNVVNPHAKGIHMSRLYLIAQKYLSKKELSIELLKKVLRDSLDSHEAISDRVFLKLDFELPILHKALVSDNSGLRMYRVEYNLKLAKDGTFSCQTSFTITYSSTCPCSAALSRELIQQKFMKDFAEESDELLTKKNIRQWLGKESSILATPHGQRSEAKIDIDWYTLKSFEVDLPTLILRAESAIKTPVQSAVKREDEQEFARLNGSHLMFAEDAARALHHLYKNQQSIAGVRVQATHYESLHAHNAQAVASSGTLLS